LEKAKFNSNVIISNNFYRYILSATFVGEIVFDMVIDDKMIVKLAELSKLEFNDAEKVEIKKDLEKIITFMEQLNAIDTEGVEPLIYVNEDVNVVREDVVKQPISKEEALSNAPLKDSDYIKVPKFVTHRS
jgi:aspartyl-tRNA(Asn)/glutamyl-tRNA(Gln) amidotransferase subunit C